MTSTVKNVLKSSLKKITIISRIIDNHDVVYTMGVVKLMSIESNLQSILYVLYKLNRPYINVNPASQSLTNLNHIIINVGEEVLEKLSIILNEVMDTSLKEDENQLQIDENDAFDLNYWLGVTENNTEFDTHEQMRKLLKAGE